MLRTPGPLTWQAVLKSKYRLPRWLNAGLHKLRSATVPKDWDVIIQEDDFVVHLAVDGHQYRLEVGTRECPENGVGMSLDEVFRCALEEYLYHFGCVPKWVHTSWHAAIEEKCLPEWVGIGQYL